MFNDLAKRTQREANTLNGLHTSVFLLGLVLLLETILRSPKCHQCGAYVIL